MAIDQLVTGRQGRSQRESGPITEQKKQSNQAYKKEGGSGSLRSLLTEGAVPGIRPNRVRLLDGLAVQREIEPFAFDLFAHAQADEDVHDLENDQRYDDVVDEDRADADALIDELLDIAVERARSSAILLDREDAGEQSADNTSDGVNTE